MLSVEATCASPPGSVRSRILLCVRRNIPQGMFLAHEQTACTYELFLTKPFSYICPVPIPVVYFISIRLEPGKSIEPLATIAFYCLLIYNKGFLLSQNTFLIYCKSEYHGALIFQNVDVFCEFGSRSLIVPNMENTHEKNFVIQTTY